jgi:hypothetical protein
MPARGLGARGRDGMAMAAATVLGVFVLVGLLDSLHYRARLDAQARRAGARYAVEVNSALDALLADLRQRGEKDLLGAAGDPPLCQGSDRGTRRSATSRA